MRAFEKRYRIRESDDVLEKLNAILLDIDQRTDAVEQVKDEFQQGNRLDVDALLNKITSDLALKSEAMQALIDETAAGFTPDRIHETSEKRFTSDAEQQGHVDAIAEANERIDGSASSDALTAHTSNNSNPHGVTAAQVGTLTTAQIDADLDMLLAEILGTASTPMNTLGKIELAVAIVTAALDKRVRVDAVQAFSPAESGQALANIGASVLAGRRSAIINGNFDIWQRGTNFAASAARRYTADRFETVMSTTTVATTREEFAQGQTDVPGSPRYFMRNVVVAGAGVGDYAYMRYAAEGVRRYAGKKSTLTFHAKANANKSMSIEFFQSFGTGGAPSANVSTIGVRKINLTTAWQKFSVTVDMPSIAGKTLGTDLNDYMAAHFWFDAGSNLNSRTGALGHQSGTFDVDHFSWALGDATAEDDPFPRETSAQVLADCLRYYQSLGVDITCLAASAVKIRYACKFPWMRVAPTSVLTTATPTIVLNDSSFVGAASALGFGAVTNDSLRGSISGFTGLTVGAPGAPLSPGLITLDAEL